MRTSDLLADGLERVRQSAYDAIDGLSADELGERLAGRANSIAWLVWHLTRVQDDHICDAAGTQQAWTTGGWAERFGLPFSPDATGYGQSSEEVGAVRADGDLLRGYLDAVAEKSLAYVATLTDTDLDRIVDERWDPPVTLGVRLISVISDDLQHCGQAALIRGLLGR
jgi:uncharacterized damage-inducible protein DinB